MSYKHLLVAIDQSPDAEALLDRAQALAALLKARLTVVSALTVVPLMPFSAGGMEPIAVPDVSINQEILAGATAAVIETCRRRGIPESDVRTETGDTQGTILRVAEELSADLIVVGHHQHRGLEKWFSHTDDKLVRRTRRDVLAVALPDADAG